MMQKKWIAIFFSLVLLLSGCSVGTTEPAEGQTPTPASPEQFDSTPQPSPSAPVDTTPQPSPTTPTDLQPQPSPTNPANSKESEEPDTNGSTQPESPDDPSLNALQSAISDSGALFGVAFLGYAELPTWNDICVYVEASGYSDDFPFLPGVTEDHSVLQAGGEVYVVVPADKDVSLTISELLMGEGDDYMPRRGKDLLTVTDGKPLLLRGNISEIVPNILIIAEKGSHSVEYSPYISGMDGSLVTGEGIYDLTPYERVYSGYPDYDQVPDAIFSGTWYAQHYDGDYNQMAMTLTLAPDGTAEYSYGPPCSDVFEQFTGTWSAESPDDEIGNDYLTLELTGGPVDSEGNAIQGEQYDFTATFFWDIQVSALVLRHESGSPLLAGTEEAWYTFMPFNGFHLLNNWSAPTEHRDWCYDLQLLENGACSFAIGEIDGEELVRYEGWWYLTDDILSLNLFLHSGAHPESPELDYIYGEYLVENQEPGSMTLTHLAGSILTLDMEETRSEHFFGLL